jgi:hypothetical protein
MQEASGRRGRGEQDPTAGPCGHAAWEIGPPSPCARRRVALHPPGFETHDRSDPSAPRSARRDREAPTADALASGGRGASGAAAFGPTPAWLPYRGPRTAHRLPRGPRRRTRPQGVPPCAARRLRLPRTARRRLRPGPRTRSPPDRGEQGGKGSPPLSLHAERHRAPTRVGVHAPLRPPRASLGLRGIVGPARIPAARMCASPRFLSELRLPPESPLPAGPIRA